MVTKEQFEEFKANNAAAIDRITAANGDTKVQLAAVRELVLALQEQANTGEAVTADDLSALLTIIEEKATEAEEISQQAQAVDDQ